MKKTIYAILGVILFSVASSSCSKVEPIDVDDIPQASLLDRDMKRWAKEKELQKQQDEDDAAYQARIKEMYDKYYESIRAYKKDPKHKIVYGWFRSDLWKAQDGAPDTFLSNLPDSVDCVSIWGGIDEFGEDDPRWEDLRIAQEVKGLRVILCWQTGTSGLGLKGGPEAFNERHKGKNSVEKAVAYAQELTAHIKKLNLNGYDIDWEPNVGDHGSGCHNLYHNCDNPSEDAAPIRAFIEEMGKNFGPKASSGYNPRNSGTYFLFDGELNDLLTRFPEKAPYFDYFIEQNYRRVVSSYLHIDVPGFNRQKLCVADEFEMGGAGAYGGAGGSKDDPISIRKAKYVRDNDLGGWACYHIELDPQFKYSRQIIHIMNPSKVFNPDKDKTNTLKDL